MAEQAFTATVTVNNKELLAKLKQLDDVVAAEALARAATAGALPIQNAAKDKAPKKTRTLARSIHTEVMESSRDSARVEVGTDAEYAAIQEFGGRIAPKGHPYLAIPLTDQAAGYAPREFPGELHVQGNALVDQAGVAQYVLAPSVTLPAHPYLRPAFDENQDRAEHDTGLALQQILQRVAPEVG